MAVQRIVTCATCADEYKEEMKPIKVDEQATIKEPGGFPGWSQINGVQLNGDPTPLFCPECTKKIMNFIDSL